MDKNSPDLIFKGIETISSDNDLIGVGLIQDGCILYANQGLAEILESSIEEILRRENYDFFNDIHPEDLDFVKKKLDCTLNQGKDTTSFLNCRILLNLGRIKW